MSEPENLHHLWDKKLDFLGHTYLMDWLDPTIWNGNRLPKYLLFRQVRWKNGLGEPYLELAQPGGIGPTVSIDWIARKYAEDNVGSEWTVVQLEWYDREPGPYIRDVCVYHPDGTETNTADREKAERLAKKEASDAEQK